MHGAYCTDIRHRHRGGMLNKTPPPTELQIPATVTTLVKVFKFYLHYAHQCCVAFQLYFQTIYYQDCLIELLPNFTYFFFLM